MHKYNEIIWSLEQNTYDMWTLSHIFEDTVMTDKVNTLSHAVLQLSTFSTFKQKYKYLKLCEPKSCNAVSCYVVITHDILRLEMSSGMFL